MRLWSIVLPILTFSAPVYAQNAVIHGLGTQSCSRWVSAMRIDDRDAARFSSWLGGYLTAYNIYGPEPTGHILRSSDWDGALAWMTNHCAANPLDDVSTAAAQLVKVLLARM